MFGFGFEDLIKFVVGSWADGSVKPRRPAPKKSKPDAATGDPALEGVARTMRLKPPRAGSERPDAWPTGGGTPYDRDQDRCAIRGGAGTDAPSSARLSLGLTHRLSSELALTSICVSLRRTCAWPPRRSRGRVHPEGDHGGHGGDNMSAHREGNLLGRVSRRLGRREAPQPVAVTDRALASALAHDEIDLYLQPVFAASDERPVALEALLRWERPDGVAPARQFFARARSNGLLREMDAQLLGSACALTRELQRSGHERLRLSINVPADELLPGRGTTGWIRNALTEGALLPQWLDIEVNEREIVGREAELAPAFSTLTAMGLGIILDNFWGLGGDHSAVRLPGVRAVKVDLWSNTGSEFARRDLEAAVEVARGQHLEVIAKRVETVFEQQFAAELGCDALQGYALALPMAGDKLRKALAPAGALRGL